MCMSYLKLLRSNTEGIRWECDCSLTQRDNDLFLARDYNRLWKSLTEKKSIEYTQMLGKGAAGLTLSTHLLICSRGPSNIQ